MRNRHTYDRRPRLRMSEDDVAVETVTVPEVFDEPRPHIYDHEGRRYERSAGFHPRLLPQDRGR